MTRSPGPGLGHASQLAMPSQGRSAIDRYPVCVPSVCVPVVVVLVGAAVGITGCGPLRTRSVTHKGKPLPPRFNAESTLGAAVGAGVPEYYTASVTLD